MWSRHWADPYTRVKQIYCNLLVFNTWAYNSTGQYGLLDDTVMQLWKHPLLQGIEQPRSEASEAVTELIHMYQNEFIILISFEGFIIPAAFPAFTLRVMSTGVHYVCLCFTTEAAEWQQDYKKRMESTACLSPSSWGCLKNKCIYSERLFEKVVQRGRVKVTLYSVFSAKLFQISIQRESQIKQSCHHVHHCRYATPVVEMVSVKWRRKAYRAARKRKRHFVSLACKHIDEMNSVPKSLSDQGHSLKPELIKLYHSFRNLLLKR